MQLFDFNDYRAYLKIVFSGRGEGRGQRSKLADHLGCQTSFLGQVLTDKAHLSLEHAIKVCDYLQFDTEERDYFMLLVQKGKAGSHALEKYFASQIKAIQDEREKIHKRINVKTDLSIEDQMHYYSVWYHAAIHILSALPKYNTVETMAQHLKLDILTVKESLHFLETRGFVQSKSGVYSIGARRMHLAKGSPLLPRHHANWRIKAIEAADTERPNDLHYTLAMGIAESDIPLFREKMLMLIEEFEPMIAKSKEDSLVILLLDLFRT